MNQRCGRCKLEKPIEDFSPSYRGKVGTWCRPCFADYHRSGRTGTSAPHDPIDCSWCGESYVPKNLKAKAAFCSRTCKDEKRKADLKAERLATKIERPCLWCGATMPPSKRADASFCSEQCNSAAHQVTRKIAKRAARYRGEDVPKRDNLVTREEIARRDNYRCGICGGKVNMDLRHPDPMAPSIDHIVPLARHGGNGDHNLQLAHLRCNLSKRAGVKPAVVQPQLCPNL